MPSPSPLSALLVSLLAAAVLPVLAQLAPTAPIENFRLPMFNQAGFREWDLRGAQGIYRGPERVDVEGMRLRLYSGDEENRLELDVTSPQATMLLQDRRALGSGTVRALGPGYELTGQKWELIVEPRRMVVEGDVRVTFFQDIGDILR
jgi:hypothetical protein